ncbi:hypothetical protein H6G81_08065 [Scytonema hofmannii FACHB-248]|uniref:Uncharacterized protein n=1 Tax=Scytonema hofmannii FACHB-248 TaxID=1842502 RepID=A0ABR8GM41_9CYAN|nr:MULTISPECIES: hypothetical protein [Nostocales]MBD2604485.1 hypothetical protein [Scytonema hofmannii FACHB-248]
MQIIKTTKDKADIQFSIDKLLILNNALNEVCNGIKLPEFSTRMGAEREEVKILLKSINKLIHALRSSETLDVKLADKQGQP